VEERFYNCGLRELGRGHHHLLNLLKIIEMILITIEEFRDDMFP
jgi:hypothetical protein